MKRNFQIAGIMTLIFAVQSFAEDNGRICLAPLPVPREGIRPPWHELSENGLVDYFVKVDNRDPVQLSKSEVSWISNLSVDESHKLIVLENSVPKESFTFNFGQYEFKHFTKKDLCLFVNNLYLTWQLYKVEQTGNWCPCWSNEAQN
jgi:hypothetical protein